MLLPMHCINSAFSRCPTYSVLGPKISFLLMQEVPEIKADAKLIQTYDLAEGSLQTNYYGIKQMIEAFIPLLQLSSSPRIVNVSSLLGRREVTVLGKAFATRDISFVWL